MKKAIITIGAVKIWTFVIIFLAFSLLPFNKTAYFANFHYPMNQEITLGTAFKTWDAEHYLFLSDKGYAKGSESDRFYPLFPYLIGIFSVPHFRLISGLFLSNLFSFVGFIYLYKFVLEWFKSEKVAFLSLVILLAFPTAFYFSLVYTESLLLFLSLGFFYYLYRNDYLKCSLFAFFLPLTRAVGIFIIIPLFIYVVIKNADRIGKLSAIRLHFDRRFFLILVPLAGYGVYFASMYVLLGNPLAGFTAAKTSVGTWSAAYIFDPTHILTAFFTPTFSLHGFTNSIIDRMFFIFFLIMLPVIYKKTNLPLFLYALAIGSVPFLGSFMSYTRYLLPAFPLFIALAILFVENDKYKLLKTPYIFISLSLETLFLIMHVLNYWIS